MLTMAGVDPAERIAAEIKVAHEAQAQADKEFADEIQKATTQLRTQEGVWLAPNKCASVHFEPVSESLKLKKGQTGTFKARTEASGGGAPASASWTLGAQENATFTPGGSEGNPLSTSYSVTDAGKGLLVSATLKATSKAGVAEDTWKQKTESLVETITGSFSGHDRTRRRTARMVGHDHLRPHPRKPRRGFDARADRKRSERARLRHGSRRMHGGRRRTCRGI